METRLGAETDLPVIDCTGCGECCRTVGHPQFFWGPIGTVDPYWEGVPENVKQELEDYIDQLKDIDIGQPCIWFNEKTLSCNHYEHRPQMCRDFKPGNPSCRRMRIERGLPVPSLSKDR